MPLPEALRDYVQQLKEALLGLRERSAEKLRMTDQLVRRLSGTSSNVDEDQCFQDAVRSLIVHRTDDQDLQMRMDNVIYHYGHLLECYENVDHDMWRQRMKYTLAEIIIGSGNKDAFLASIQQRMFKCHEDIVETTSTVESHRISKEDSIMRKVARLFFFCRLERRSQQEITLETVNEEVAALNDQFASMHTVHVSEFTWRRLLLYGFSILNMWFGVTAFIFGLAVQEAFVMQFFLNFLTSPNEVRSCYVTFGMFPLSIVLMTLYLYYAYLSIKSSFQSPPFTKLRAYMITIWAVWNNKMHLAVKLGPTERKLDCDVGSEDWTAFRVAIFWIDMYFTLCSRGMMLVTCVACVSSFGLSPSSVWAGLSMGGFLWTFITNVIYIVSDVYLHYFGQDQPAVASFAMRVQGVLTSSKCLPGGMYVRARAIELGMMRVAQTGPMKMNTVRTGNPFFGSCIEKALETGESCLDGSASAPLMEANGQRRIKAKDSHWLLGYGFFPLLAGGLSIWMIGSRMVDYFTRETFHLQMIFTSLLFQLAIFFVNGAFKEVMPTLRRTGAYQVLLWIFWVLTTLLFLGSASRNMGLAADPINLSDEDVIVYANTSDVPASGYPANGNVRAVWFNNGRNAFPGYPVCSMRWASSELGIMDLATLASYAYTQGEMQYEALIKAGFVGARGIDSIEQVHFDPYEAVPRLVATRFNSDDAERDTIVIAVKGTSTPHDAYTDLGLYASVALLQVASVLSPVLQQLPNSFLAWWIGASRLPLTRRIEDRMLWSVVSTVRNISYQYPNATIVLTGHSLGGGIAEAVAAQMLMSAVVFSAPGAHFGRSNFRTNMERQYRNIVGIMPDNDPVPRVDTHDDMLQHIECRDRDGQPRSYCHGMATTLCELWRSCGDFRRRNFGQYCSAQVRDSDLGAYFTGDDRPTEETKEDNYHYGPPSRWHMRPLGQPTLV